ncbi:MAG: hypothetical protein ABI440_03950 [Casimicrobiaceae bacterium]
MLITPRNPVVRSPLMRTGGVHAKTHAAQRRHAKNALVRALREPETTE